MTTKQELTDRILALLRKRYPKRVAGMRERHDGECIAVYLDTMGRGVFETQEDWDRVNVQLDSRDRACSR